MLLWGKGSCMLKVTHSKMKESPQNPNHSPWGGRQDLGYNLQLRKASLALFSEILRTFTSG